MKKRRLIPTILLKDGIIVQSRNFLTFNNLGDPLPAIKRYSEWCSDELIFLDISRGLEPKNNRTDLNFKKRIILSDIIEDISRYCFMPITVGGKINNLEKIEEYLSKGADKVAINTYANLNHKFIEIAAKNFGSQCIVNSIDVKIINGDYKIFIRDGSEMSQYNLQEWLKISEESGSGEILINSIDRDGLGNGFDINLINFVNNFVKIPVICSGGAGKYEDFLEVALQTNVDGIAAANFFQYKEHSVFLTKKLLFDNGLNFRKPELLKI
jgi:imidazole glycerol-phosphate synthase subunit HisF